MNADTLLVAFIVCFHNRHLNKDMVGKVGGTGG